MNRPEPDTVYFERRAREETAAAERAVDDRTRQLHVELAERYSKAARSGRLAPTGDEMDELPSAPRLRPAEFRILG